jgi:pSer/pThr/pTyr-binding forkhead associated (FHA) protein
MPAGQAFPVAAAIRVGRDTECEIFLVDPSVSRNHATVEPVDGELVVRDAGSTNGTFVNGQRIQLRSVRPGDVVAFGKTEMRVES